jgi:DNA-binding transcriptional ArsR family regulator
MLYSYNMTGKVGRISDVPGPHDDELFDQVFKALSSRTRRSILDLLKDHPRTTGEICAHFPGLDRCTTMQHLGVLQRAGLVIAQRKGRERWNHLDVLPIKQIQDRWIGDYAASAVDLLAALRADLEAPAG